MTLDLHLQNVTMEVPNRSCLTQVTGVQGCNPAALGREPLSRPSGRVRVSIRKDLAQLRREKTSSRSIFATQELTTTPPPSKKTQNKITNKYTAHTYIYIYMLWSYYLVQVWGFQGSLSGPRWGHYLVQVCFFYLFESGFKRSLNTQLSFCVLCAQLSCNFLKTAFFQKGAIFFSIVCVLSFKILNSLFYVC